MRGCINLVYYNKKDKKKETKLKNMDDLEFNSSWGGS